ncbi:hypothetical protein NLU13_7450 [Sarocladium strictum]|uniref:BZIP domain-containing protein n=1 Tax=Sarocladium strictum TaxID=5046 RepID=A0AA39GF71_SARSR|nr:hypothetical protein NLU13_7450 [Sarocladium strictum]
MPRYPQSTSDTSPGRRSRPRKPVDGELAKVRREKNRIAQREFRVRQQSLEKEQAQRLTSLEATLDRVVSIFLHVTDRALQSHCAQRDLQLIGTLRQSINDVLQAVGPAQQSTEVQHTDFEQYAVRSTVRNTPSDDGGLRASSISASEPLLGTEHGIDVKPTMSLEITPPASVSPAPLPDDRKVLHHSISSIFVNGLMGQMTPYDLFGPSIEPAKTSVSGNLTLQLAHVALTRAYGILLNAANLSDPRILRSFGFLLQRRSRDEALRRMHMRLKQGPAGLGSMTNITVSQCIARLEMEAKEANDTSWSSSRMDVKAKMEASGLTIPDDLCNADELSALIQQRIHGESSGEVLDVYVPSPRPVFADDETFFNNSVWMPTSHTITDPWYGVSTNVYENPSDMRLMRVSKARLLENLSAGGMCLGGPFFQRSRLDQAILLSVVC